MTRGRPFKKGISGNPDGKPKGAKGKKTLAWERLGKYLIGEGAQRYELYLMTLDEKKFAEEFRNILEYFKPKQQRTDLTSGNKPIIINFNTKLKDV